MDHFEGQSNSVESQPVQLAVNEWLNVCTNPDMSHNLIARGLLAAGVSVEEVPRLSADIAADPAHAKLQAPFVSGFQEGVRWLIESTKPLEED